MSVAYMSVHRPNGYFVTKEGWEYVGFIGAASLAASVLGGGRLSVDRLLGLHTAGTPVTRAAVTAACGVAGAVIQLALFWRGPRRASRRGLGAQAPEPHVPQFGEHIAGVSSEGWSLGYNGARAGGPYKRSVSRRSCG